VVTKNFSGRSNGLPHQRCCGQSEPGNRTATISLLKKALSRRCGGGGGVWLVRYKKTKTRHREVTGFRIVHDHRRPRLYRDLNFSRQSAWRKPSLPVVLKISRGAA